MEAFNERKNFRLAHRPVGARFVGECLYRADRAANCRIRCGEQHNHPNFGLPDGRADCNSRAADGNGCSAHKHADKNSADKYTTANLNSHGNIYADNAADEYADAAANRDDQTNAKTRDQSADQTTRACESI